ncbi:unnamed protein product, partial [Gulo gulo]
MLGWIKRLIRMVFQQVGGSMQSAFKCSTQNRWIVFLFKEKSCT